MLQEIKKSKCCKADVKIEGIPDFIGDDESLMTLHYICSRCKKDCDTYIEDDT